MNLSHLRNQNWFNWILTVAPYSILLLGCFFVFNTSVDDPFITFRYAANFLAGHGPVYNIGEHVEADTSPLHMLCCTLLLLLPTSAGMLFKAKILSIFFAALTLWQMRRIGLQLGIGKLAAAVCVSMAALNSNFEISSVNGLETTIFSFMILWSAQVFLKELASGRGFGSAWILVAAMLTRPETPIIFAGLFLIRIAFADKRAKVWRNNILWSLTFIVPAIFFAAARHWYYGQYFPNTYYAKLGVINPVEGLKYISTGLWACSVPFRLRRLADIADFVFWISIFCTAVINIRNEKIATLTCLVVAESIAVMRSNGDWMPGWRFMVPVLPLAILIFGYGVFSRIRLMRSTGHATWKFLAGAFAANFVLWILLCAVFPKNPWSRSNYSTSDRRLVETGYKYGPLWIYGADWISRHCKPGSIVAYSELGYAGYCNRDKQFIDLRGLTDKQIANDYPAIDKGLWGIADHHWYEPSSIMYRILEQRRPVEIMTFDFESSVVPPQMVLNTYQVQSSKRFAGLDLACYCQTAKSTGVRKNKFVQTNTLPTSKTIKQNT